PGRQGVHFALSAVTASCTAVCRIFVATVALSAGNLSRSNPVARFSSALSAASGPPSRNVEENRHPVLGVSLRDFVDRLIRALFVGSPPGRSQHHQRCSVIPTKPARR